ncbi:hypothetical protein CIPAW_10G088800 [Carya illinoinensis]|uniref:DUF7392 domain-containing protein n=2 Tax=Carya illinoinensis TaxID=32201 RepID=A0A8T1PAX3_CARIL|nr:hypothetical protein CIPAW_10G088800 [Carya illinoinensis]
MSTRPVQSNLPLFSHSIQQSLIFNGRLGSTHKVFWLTLIPLEIKFETLESQKEDNRMACFVPFSNRNLDLSFFVFRPTVVLVDDFVDALKQFSLCTESLGCVQTSIFKSIHGNMIVWYGAWLKKTSENKELLCSILMSMLTNISNMAILIEHGFFDAYAGESRDASSLAMIFHTGDIISMNAAVGSAADADHLDDLSYTTLALFKSAFLKMEGVSSGVCLKSQVRPRVACLFVWKSIQFCYSWVLNSDHKRSMLPYFNRFSLDCKYDMFRVVYVGGDNVPSLQSFPASQMLENAGGSKEEGHVIQS